MLWRFCFCLSLQKLSQTEQNVSSLDRTDRPVLYCPCRRWPETRRTITRTHPNRSRGKLTSTSAATRTTSTASWTRWPLRSRWSSREIVEPLLDFVLFSVSGWDGPDSGETVSMRTAESESESQRREAFRDERFFCVSSRTFQTLLDISLVPLLPVNTSCLYSVSEILSWSCCQLSSVFWMANMYFLNISMIETAWSSSGGCFSFSRMKISSQRRTAEFDQHTVSQDVFQILT